MLPQIRKQKRSPVPRFSPHLTQGKRGWLRSPLALLYSLPSLPSTTLWWSFCLVFAAFWMNEAWSPKKPIWGKPVLGQFPGYIQPQPLSSHRRGLSYPIVCIHHILLIHSSINGHLGCFLKDNFIKLFKRIAILDRNLFKSSCVPALLYEKEVGYGVEISRPLGFDLRIRSLAGFLSFELRTRSSKPKS